MFAIRQERLERDGEPFAVVGVNYHPSTAGCRYWQDWPEAEIAAALTCMAAHGVNVVRFFLFWRDFEPRSGQYDEVVFDRLVRFTQLAEERGLFCLPSLLTIWMNGQRFDPDFREGRSLWSDADMRAHARHYVRAVARRLRDRPNVIAYDLGDELPYGDPNSAFQLTPPQVREWIAEMTDAICEEHAGALVCQANDCGSAFGAHAFGPENTSPRGLVAMHAFPVWSPIEAESWSSYKSTILTSFAVRFGARAGAVLVDEIGCYGGDEEVTARYLDATLHAQLANGGVGAAIWCWQDFTSCEKPFELRPQERTTGLIDAAGRAKPALSTLESYAATARALTGFRPEAPVVAILARNAPDERVGGYLAQPLDSAIGVFYAFALAKRAHLPCELVTEPQDRHRLLLCPSLHALRLQDLDALRRFVERGGHVYASISDHLHGFPGEQLTGLRLRDFKRTIEQSATFEHRGLRYRIPLRQSAMRSAISPAGAEVLGMFEDGSPALTQFAVGQGRFIFLNAPFEESLNEPGLLESHPWHELYGWLALEAGVIATLACDSPDVECAVLTRSGRAVGLLVNHAGEERTVVPAFSHHGVVRTVPPVMIPAKGTHVLELKP